MYINIYDLNFDTLWTKTILSITSYLLQKLIEKEEKKESRITTLGSFSHGFHFRWNKDEIGFCRRFGLTKRNETKRNEMRGSARFSRDELVVARSSTGRFSRFATRSLPAPVSCVLIFDNRIPLETSFPLFDSARW